jgi:hypothetical protein
MLQGIVRGFLRQKLSLHTGICQQRSPALARGPTAGQAGFEADGVEDKRKHDTLFEAREVCPAGLKCKNQVENII